jgi:hypothetical protein
MSGPHRLTALGLAALVGCTGPAPERKVVQAAPRVQAAPTARQMPEAAPEAAGEEAGGDDGIGADGGEALVLGEEVPAVNAAPQVPEDYGRLKPPLPAPTPDALKVHAMAGYEVVTVYGKPDLTADKLGYMRIGTRTMVTEKVEGEGCKHGFYGLPAGGFACASKGLVVDREREPPLRHPPPAPRMDHPLPYEYGFVRRWNGPMWWRVPTAEELQAMVVQREEREKIRKAEVATKKGGLEEPPLPGVATEPAQADPVVTQDAASRDELAKVKLPLSPDTPWLERGFFLVARREDDRGRALVLPDGPRGVRGGRRRVGLRGEGLSGGRARRGDVAVRVHEEGDQADPADARREVEARSRRWTSGCSSTSRRRSTSRGGPT